MISNEAFFKSVDKTQYFRFMGMNGLDFVFQRLFVDEITGTVYVKTTGHSINGTGSIFASNVLVISKMQWNNAVKNALKLVKDRNKRQLDELTDDIKSLLI